MCMSQKDFKNKIRVNISVDRILLHKAKTKLNLFGGKLSTLFNAYLKDFVSSMDKDSFSDFKSIDARVKELERKIERLEKSS